MCRRFRRRATRSTKDIDIVVNLEQGNYGAGRRVSVPEGYRLVINGASRNVVFQGSSPALTLDAGTLLVHNGVTFTNTTDAPTILVTVRGRGYRLEAATGEAPAGAGASPSEARSPLQSAERSANRGTEA